jgi:hypothetical protein
MAFAGPHCAVLVRRPLYYNRALLYYNFHRPGQAGHKPSVRQTEIILDPEKQWGKVLSVPGERFPCLSPGFPTSLESLWAANEACYFNAQPLDVSSML